MANKSILVTGGAGFQGSFLTEKLLSLGHAVTVLNTYSSRSVKNLGSIKGQVNLVWGSITDKELVAKTIRDHDVVFHLAAHINVDESIKDPVATLNANVSGMLNVLEAIRQHKNRLILASTCEVYGETYDGVAITEDKELRPQSPYAASKAAADRLTYAYYRTYDIDTTIVRPFNIFGPRQKIKGGALIPILINKALNKEPLTIFGDGQQTRDYPYVDDLVAAYLLVFKHKLKGEVINFGTGIERSISDIAEYIAKKLGANIVKAPARPGEVKKFIADTTKAKKLGFVPKTDFWQGIDNCIEWYKEHNNYEK